MGLFGEHVRSRDSSQMARDRFQLTGAQLDGAASAQLAEEDWLRSRRLVEAEPGSPERRPKALYADEDLGVAGRRGRRDRPRFKIGDSALTTAAELGEHPPIMPMESSQIHRLPF